MDFMISDNVLPGFIKMLIREIAQFENVRVYYGINEIEINAPDPGEKDEEKAVKKINCLKDHLEVFGVKFEKFERESGKIGGEKEIDAIRIYLQ